VVAGKLSGYNFVSFRVYNIKLARENGKLVRKKYNVVGTAGQALMSPPEVENGKVPMAFYNLGGVLANFLFSGLCFWFYLLLPDPWSIIFLASAIGGVFMGLANIIPLKIKGVPNDGYNLFLLSRKQNADVRHAFWVQLKANALQTSGVRARDFPPAWFEWVTPDTVNDPIIAAVAMLHYAYLLDRLELTEARELAQTTLDTVNKMGSIHKNEFRCELLFHELIGECRQDEIKRIYTTELQAYVKATAIYASRQRLLYAYARLFLRDAAKADAHLVLFHRACEKSASLGEIPGEQELIAVVDGVVEQREAVTL